MTLNETNIPCDVKILTAVLGSNVIKRIEGIQMMAVVHVQRTRESQATKPDATIATSTTDSARRNLHSTPILYPQVLVASLHRNAVQALGSYQQA